jgi:hypothetical protein
MTPVKPSNNQQNCNPISSNCVTWQGPDIACINLQKGDTVSDVTYKLALELCTVLEQTDILNYDLTCFEPVCPKPDNFQQLVQFLIDKLCELNNCCNQTVVTTPPTSTNLTTNVQATGNCPDCVITVAQCFQYTDNFGNNITTMNIADYAAAIGTKVCTLSTQFSALQSTVANQGARLLSVENWINNYAPVIPSALSNCLFPGNVVQVTIFCQTLEQQFCQLKSAVGDPSKVYSAIQKQCSNLDSSPTLYGNGIMSNISGWVAGGQYASAADAINNLWLTVCDLRSAVDNILNTCCNDSLVCNTVDIYFGSLIYAAPTLTIPLLGSIPSTSTDCTTGTVLTVKDMYNNMYNTTPSIVSTINATPISLNLSTSSVTQWTDYNVILTYCIETGSSSIACTSTISVFFENAAMIPTLSLIPAANDIAFSFTDPGAPSLSKTFHVQLYDSTATTPVGSAISIVNPQSALETLGQFLGLASSTNYNIRIGTQIGTYVRYGAFIPITTL